jgi:hypothetical protein
VIDDVLHLIMIFAVIGSDRLPCSISYCILVRGSESWALVMTKHIRSTKDLHDCLVLFSSEVQNSLESESWTLVMTKHITSKGLDLVGVVVHLFLLSITQRSVVFIIFAFSLIALFFFFIFLMVIIVVVILR